MNLTSASLPIIDGEGVGYCITVIANDVTISGFEITNGYAGAEITLSPIHACAMDTIRKGGGLDILFPRFTGNYRLDKATEDATTVNEIIKCIRVNLKQSQNNEPWLVFQNVHLLLSKISVKMLRKEMLRRL